MNLLSTIIDRLNQRVAVGNIFDQIYGLSELAADGNDKAWIHYIGNGQAIPVTNFDAKQGTLFWAKRGKISVNKIETFKLAGCKSMYETRYSLSANAVVRKSHLPCDSADAQDWIASRVLKLISGTDPQFKTAIGVVSYEVVPNGYTNEIKSLPANYEWASVTIDVDINVVSGSEDGCYDTCATGDIPLPDFEPCTPCLTEVAVDGVTITGNGTPADPLVAIGGGGGTPLRTQDEGVNVSTNTTTLNFTGAGVTASLTSPGVVEVNVPGGGGGGEDLQQTTDIGNTTTNDIDFIGNAGLAFDNGARFRKGTTDAGNGGAKGTAQICSISYELKWEAGRLYYMEQDGFTIRDVTHNFTFVPQPTDDQTKGFVVGTRWSLDDGTVYVCTDDTVGAAVWVLQSGGGVTAVTATAPIASSGGATPDISITQADATTDGYLSSADWATFDGKQDALTAGTGISITGVTIDNTAPDQIVSLLSGIDINVTGTYPNFTIDNTNPDQVVSLTAGTGIITTGTYPSFTIDNSAPDQVVQLTPGTSIGVSGTYPNFTIDNTDPDQVVSLTAGTGISTSGTYPNFTIDNTAPDQVVSITGGTDITVTGTYPSFTIDSTAATGMQGGTASGTDTYTVSIPGVTSYNTNDAYAIGFTNANTGASTLNINGLGAVNISKNNVVPIIGGDIAANQQFIAIYDGTNFQLLGVAPNQMFAYITNADSVTINRGQPVYAFGATGDRMTVKLANNTSEATSSKTVGLVFSSSIGPNQKGYIITQGVIDGINTNAYTAGDTLYVGNTAGALTNTMPFAPNHLTRIGIVERANAGNGQIYVFVQNGFQLDELSDVDITTTPLANNQFLVYTTGTNNLWKNRTLGNVLGGTTSQYVRGDGSLATFPTIPTVTPSALTRTNDTNVTLTLGGSPSTALLQPSSLTLGWTGQLAVSRGGTGLSSLGTSLQYLRVNSAGTSLEYATLPTSGTVTSVSATVPAPTNPALSVNVTNPTTTPAIAITANGTTSQYVRGDGSLATFPAASASVVYKSAISSATHTGTANTVKYTQLIPANTFAAGDVVRITYRTAKTGTANSMTLRIYANATPDLSGSPILLGSHQNVGAPLFLVNQMIRHLAIKTANNNTEVYFAPGLGVATDYGLYDLTSTCAVDWTQQQYIVFALQLNSTGTDVTFGSFYMIEKP